MVLITGDMGYIGGNLKMPHISFDLKCGKDIRNKTDLEEVFKNNKIETVIHLGALIDVGNGEKYPLEYYYTNVEGTRLVLEVMKKYNCNKIIFASSASVYGNHEGVCSEDTPTNPVNVYGKTKLMGEEIIKDSGVDYVIFRFFNVAGGNQQGDSLISKIKNSERITIYGTDYETKDGTCVRDFIHVEDICQAIIKSIDYQGVITLNLGSNSGYSVLEVVTEANIPYDTGRRREGDIIVSICDNRRAKETLGWTPKKTLKEML
jgi:UDP-glucose 4-epimerase